MPTETVSALGKPPIMPLSFIAFDVFIVGCGVIGFGFARNTEAASPGRDNEKQECLQDTGNGLIRDGDLVEYGIPHR